MYDTSMHQFLSCTTEHFNIRFHYTILGFIHVCVLRIILLFIVFRPKRQEKRWSISNPPPHPPPHPLHPNPPTPTPSHPTPHHPTYPHPTPTTPTEYLIVKQKQFFSIHLSLMNFSLCVLPYLWLAKCVQLLPKSAILCMNTRHGSHGNVRDIVLWAQSPTVTINTRSTLWYLWLFFSCSIPP